MGRITTLRKQLKIDIPLVSLIECSMAHYKVREIEQKIHESLGPKRLDSEWFSLDTQHIQKIVDLVLRLDSGATVVDLNALSGNHVRSPRISGVHIGKIVGDNDAPEWIDKTALASILHSDQKESGLSLRSYAANIGVSAPYLLNVINGKKLPSQNIADRLGYDLVLAPAYLRRREPGEKVTRSLGVSAVMSYSIPDHLTTSTAMISQGVINGQSNEASKKEIQVSSKRKRRKR